MKKDIHYLDKQASPNKQEIDFRFICKAYKINEERAFAMAKQTIRNVIERMKMDKSKSHIVDYFNNYSISSDPTINAFLSSSKVSDIAKLFRLKSNIKVSIGDCSKASHINYTFVCLRKHYDYFQKNGQIPKVLANGSIDRGLAKNRTLLAFDNGGSVKIPQNETWKRFKSGLKRYNLENKSNYTAPQMVLSILEQYMNDRPQIFDEKTVVIDENKIKKTGTTFIHINIDNDLANDLKAFIQRYNEINMPCITMRSVYDKALRQFLERMPLQYTNPELYYEEKALEQQASTEQ